MSKRLDRNQTAPAGVKAPGYSMLAWRVHKFGPPEAMILERIPRPDPGPGEVLVDVHAVGVGPWDGWTGLARAHCRSLFLLRSTLICPEQSQPWDLAFPNWLLNQVSV
jgi:hypothetical protein